METVVTVEKSNRSMLIESDPQNLGALFYFFEKACGISGYVLGVNPFDQPGYEAQAEELRARL
jgi:glucose-6-phosphate isomerase